MPIRVPRFPYGRPNQNIDERYTYGPPIPPRNEDEDYLRSSLWCMTYYFNPKKFKTRYTNFLLFYQRLRTQTQNILVFEVALSKNDFVLHEVCSEENLVQIVDTSLIWQKERLFNVGLKLLPKSCGKIVWVDCDILFDNNDWVLETSSLLDHYTVVQPYYQNARLPSTISNIDHGININTFHYGYGDEQRSDGDIHGRFKEKIGISWWGHPGYAYGYRRELLEKHGLYDRCITGSSDTLISQAVIGVHKQSRIILDYYNEACLKHYQDWAEKFYFDIGLNINFARATNLYHLYHGQTRKRKYFSRLKFLKEIDFDYSKDLTINYKNGCYAVKRKKREIHKWLDEYYKDRQDDEQENL